MTSAPKRWAQLGWAVVPVILTFSTWFSTAAVAPELTAAWRLTAPQSGWLTNAVQIGFVTGALASSLLALGDIWRLQRLMAGSAAVAALANAFLVLEPGYEAAIAARFLTGAALAGIYPPAMKYVATWFVAGRGLALGVMVGALTVGSAAPHLLRGIGADLAWQEVLLATSLGCVISAAILLTLRDGPHPFTATRIDLRQFGRIFANRPAMLANVGYFGHMWELYAMWGWFLAYANAALAAGNPVFAGNASLLAFAVIAFGGPGCVLGGLLSDRIGRCLSTSLMMAVSGGCAVLIGLFFNGPAPIFAAIAFLWGLTVVADSAQFSTAVTELSDRHLVGSMLAFQMGIGFAITAFTIWLVPQIAEWLGSWRWTFLVLAPGPAVGIAAMLVLWRHPAARRMSNGLR